MKETLPTPCSSWREKLAATHPDDLTPMVHKQLQAHLATCATCAAIRAEYEAIGNAISQLPRVDHVPELSLALSALLNAQASSADETQRGESSSLASPGQFASSRSTSRMSFSDAVRQMNTSSRRMISQAGMTRDERNRGVLSSSHHTIPQRLPGRRFAVLAAVLIAALLVGSVVLVLNRVAHTNGSLVTYTSYNTINQSQGPQPQDVKTPEGVYVGGFDGIARLDRQTGKTLWKYSYSPKAALPDKIVALGNTVYISLVDYGNTLAASTSAVLAIDAQTGHLRWSHTYKGAAVKDLITAGNMLYAGNSDSSKSTIYAYYATNGLLHATYQVSGNVQAFSLANNALYINSSAGLFALSLSNGKQLWYNASITAVGLVKSYVVNKILYIATSVDGRKIVYRIAAFNTDTGGTLWRDDILDEEVDALAVVNGKVFVGTSVVSSDPLKGNLRMYDARDGKLDWTRGLDGTVIGAPTIDNNRIYASIMFQSSNLLQEVAAFALANGHIQWKVQVAAGYVTQAIVDNGVVYVSNSSSNTRRSSITIALNAANSRPVWTVPSSVGGILAIMVAD